MLSTGLWEAGSREVHPREPWGQASRDYNEMWAHRLYTAQSRGQTPTLTPTHIHAHRQQECVFPRTLSVS